MFALLTASTIVSTSAGWAQDENPANYVDRCQAAFADDNSTLHTLVGCVALWDEQGGSAEHWPLEHAQLARALRTIHVSGDPAQRVMADRGLERLGRSKPIPDPRTLAGAEMAAGFPNVRPGASVVTAPVRHLLASVDPPRPSRRAIRLAARRHGEAMTSFGAGEHEPAIHAFESALRAHPFYVPATYDLARALALKGDTAASVAVLRELRSWNDSTARAAFARARTERDLENLHEDPAFRDLVSLVRVKLLYDTDPDNLPQDAGGAPLVPQIRRDLMAFEFHVVERPNDSNAWEPTIYYRAGLRRRREESWECCGTG